MIWFNKLKHSSPSFGGEPAKDSIDVLADISTKWKTLWCYKIEIYLYYKIHNKLTQKI